MKDFDLFLCHNEADKAEVKKIGKQYGASRLGHHERARQVSRALRQAVKSPAVGEAVLTRV
jgi:hypothetical protein